MNSDEQKPPLIVVGGPTACGKTGTAIALAKALGGEVVSADSMQIYRYMDIGTAKPSTEEMEGVPHHLIDALYPDEAFSVAVFKDLAKRAIDDIYARGKMPIVVGGTGFYINALLRDNEFTPAQSDEAFRREMYELAKERGSGFVHNMLKDVDPVSHESIHMNNVKRVVRALEYARLTGEPISAHNARERAKGGAYDARVFILYSERQALYERIDRRVDDMIDAGLVQEVERLLSMGYGPRLVSMQGLGYKEIVPVITGETTLPEATELVKRNTRHFAKRQLTWFRRQMEGVWIDMGRQIPDLSGFIMGCF